MAFQPAPNIAQCELRGTMFGQNIENTLYFKNPDGVDATTLAELATIINAWMTPDYLAFMPSSFTFRELYLKDLTTESGEELTDVTHQSEPGLLGLASPGNVSFVVKFLTGLTGRSFRGRNYLPVPSNVTAGNQVSAFTAGNYVQVYLNLLAAVGAATGNWQWVILSRIADGVLRPTAIGTPVTSASYSDLDLDSQRRRLTGRGA